VAFSLESEVLHFAGFLRIDRNSGAAIVLSKSDHTKRPRIATRRCDLIILPGQKSRSECQSNAAEIADDLFTIAPFRDRLYGTLDDA